MWQLLENQQWRSDFKSTVELAPFELRKNASLSYPTFPNHPYLPENMGKHSKSLSICLYYVYGYIYIYDINLLWVSEDQQKSIIWCLEDTSTWDSYMFIWFSTTISPQRFVFPSLKMTVDVTMSRNLGQLPRSNLGIGVSNIIKLKWNSIHIMMK